MGAGSGQQFGQSFPQTGEMPAFGSTAATPQFGQAYPQTGFMGAFDAAQLRKGFGPGSAFGQPEPQVIPGSATPAAVSFRNPLADAGNGRPFDARTPSPRPQFGGVTPVPGAAATPPPPKPPARSGPKKAPNEPKKAPSVEISKLLTETDVYIKYGLRDKAVEHLNKLLALDPLHIDAYYKMRDIYLGAKDSARAAEAVANILRIYAHIGDEERLESIRAELRSLAPGHPLAQPGVIPPPPTAIDLAKLHPKEEDAVDIDIDIDDDAEGDSDAEAQAEEDEGGMVAAEDLDDEPGVEMELEAAQDEPEEEDDLGDEPMPYQEGMPDFGTGDIHNVNEAMFGLFGEAPRSVTGLSEPQIIAPQSPLARAGSGLNRYDAALAEAPDEDEPSVFGVATPAPSAFGMPEPEPVDREYPTERITRVPDPIRSPSVAMPSSIPSPSREAEDAAMRDALFLSSEDEEPAGDAGAVPLADDALLTAEEAEAALAGLDESLGELGELGEGGLDELEEEEPEDLSAQALMGMGTGDIEASRRAYESYFAQSSEASGGDHLPAEHLPTEVDLVGEPRAERPPKPRAHSEEEPHELLDSDFAELDEPKEDGEDEAFPAPPSFDEDAATGDLQSAPYDEPAFDEPAVAEPAAPRIGLESAFESPAFESPAFAEPTDLAVAPQMGKNGEARFEAREASEEEAVAAVPELDEEIEGELDEADFLLSQSMLDEARENILTILEKSPAYPRALSMLENVEKQLGLR